MAGQKVENIEKNFHRQNYLKEMVSMLKSPGEVRDRLAVVLDVLDHVQADNRSHLAFIGKRHKLRACNIGNAQIETGKPLASLFHRSGVDIDTDIIAIAAQHAGIAAVSNTDFEH